MRFEEQFCTVNAGYRSGSGFLKDNVELECCCCEQPTSWFHLELLLYFCSEDCYAAYLSKPAECSGA